MVAYSDGGMASQLTLLIGTTKFRKLFHYDVVTQKKPPTHKGYLDSRYNT